MTTQTVHKMVGSTLRNRALMANALCAVAEEEVHAGRVIEAVETVRAIRTLLADINLLLSGDTSYLPHGTLRDCADMLGGLDERITAIERSLKTQRIH